MTDDDYISDDELKIRLNSLPSIDWIEMKEDEMEQVFKEDRSELRDQLEGYWHNMWNACNRRSSLNARWNAFMLASEGISTISQLLQDHLLDAIPDDEQRVAKMLELMKHHDQ